MFPELILTAGTAGWATTATTSTLILQRRLHTDLLTGIGNRVALHRRAQTRRLFTSRRGLVGLLMVDLDRFKAINDTYGHDFGNKVLAAVAARLVDTTRRGELAVRLHGDEFAVWLGRTTPGLAECRAAEIADTLAVPVWVDGHRIAAGGSVGLALAPAKAPLADLLSQADAHMYATKAAHRVDVLPTGRPHRTRDHHIPGGEAA
jgi:diguanylate cyclase (GGDEF)-like protein